MPAGAWAGRWERWAPPAAGFKGGLFRPDAVDSGGWQLLTSGRCFWLCCLQRVLACIQWQQQKHACSRGKAFPLPLACAGQSVYVFKPDAEGGSSLSVSVMEVSCCSCPDTPECIPCLALLTQPLHALTPTQCQP
jgi:hypothetical protein